MRCEAEVHARLRACDAELGMLSDEIAKLSLEVKLGAEGWRVSLETLSARLERRRALLAQQDSLHWVLAAEQELLAG